MSNNYNNFTNITNVTIIEDPAELSFAKPLAHLCQVPVEEVNVRDFLTIEEFLHTAFTVVVFLAVIPAIASTFSLFKHFVYTNIISHVKDKVKSILKKAKEKVTGKNNTPLSENNDKKGGTKIKPTSMMIEGKEISKEEAERRKTVLDSGMKKFRKTLKSEQFQDAVLAHKFMARSASFSSSKSSKCGRNPSEQCTCLFSAHFSQN